MELPFDDLFEYIFRTTGKRWSSTHHTPVGTWLAEWQDDTIIAFRLLSKEDEALSQESVDSEKEVRAKFDTQLDEYFSGKRQRIEIATKFSGTPFQEDVWIELLRIPYGSTMTYSEIAAKIGNPKAVRAVGTAIGRNPLPILIPCHRVVARNSLGGFAYGLQVKQTLLTIESKGAVENESITETS
jgi:O-6-methylguanine DNA methyltransferase